MAVWHSCVGLLESHAPAIQRWELLLSTVAALGCGGTVAAGMYAVHWPTLTSAQLNLIVPAVAAFASLLVQCVIHASYQG
ncbi:MAG: hypothetical protein P4L40_25185 [Terracidiphilus sp.]|nr:hypothetical protein [Terracidiphilus sp.]